MIRHIVLFTLKPEIDESDREWLFGRMQALARLPSVRRLAIGKLLEPREEWYRARIAQDFGWAFSMEFDDEDALYAYQKDPEHAEVAQEIRKRVSVIKVTDFVSPKPVT
jgi:hypothetical protein